MKCGEQARLHALVDGELEPAEADEVRAHLGGCAECAAELPRLMALLGVLEEVGAARSPAAPHPPHLVPLPGGQADGPGLAPANPAVGRGAVRRIAALVVTSLLAAAVVIVLLRDRGRRSALDPDGTLLADARGPRPCEARLTYPGLERHRPYSTARGRADSAAAQPSFAALAQLEQRGDWHGVGVASLLRGDLAQARRYLARAPRTPEVDADRAAVLLATGDEQELGAVVAQMDRVLQQRPNYAPAEWNRALALARLGLGRLAAEGFERVAARGEAGWSGEARDRARALRATADELDRDWHAAWEAGRRMIRDGTLLPDPMVDGYPGLARLCFYDALRAAPSRERVMALLPLAQRLDRIAGGDTLERTLRRTAAADFRRRAPLAQKYADVATDKLVGEARRALEHSARRAGADDLVMGTLIFDGGVGAALAEYRRLADATADPWFAALAAHEEAKAALARGDLAAAESRLVAAIRQARQQKVDYRTELLELELAKLYCTLGRFPEATTYAQQGLQRARAGAEWMHQYLFLSTLAEIARQRYALALSRAYLSEFLLAARPSCQVERYVHLELASLDAIALEPAAARRELQKAPLCGEPISLLAAQLWAELAPVDGTPADVAWVRDGLVARRARGLGPGQQAEADEIEGRLIIGSDAARGRSLLRSAIARAAAAGDEVYAQKARAYSYAALVMADGQAGAWGEALAALAEEIGVPTPDRCTLGVALENDRGVFVARGPDGALAGAYTTGSSPEIEPATLIPRSLIGALGGCAQVDVLARPPLIGVPHLLPAELAWSYRARRPVAASASPAAPRRVVVSRVEPPANLQLAPLGPGQERPPEHIPLVELTGAAATPSRVLAALSDATEVEFRTHGLVDHRLSDASSLILSADADGHYAITSADVRRLKLRGAPLVILGACNAGEGAPYYHDAASLPVAFIDAGAAAVLASAEEVEDEPADAFFAAVRARIRAGVAAAVALRDVRRAWRTRPDSVWVDGVVVYR